MFILQIYPCELEKAEKFNDFADFCHSFQFSRGKDEDDEESNIVGELKVKKKIKYIFEIFMGNPIGEVIVSLLASNL